MNIAVAIMSHPSRVKHANKLYKQLKKQGFYAVDIILDLKNDEWSNGKNCWEWLQYSIADYGMVIQDDAIISPNFYKNIAAAVDHLREECALSLYTGTVRPYRALVSNAVMKANYTGSSFLKSHRLHWGVCVIMPTDKIKPMLNATEGLRDLYDVRIGKAARKVGLPVFYTNPSLVDHDNSIGSVVGTTSKEPRVAHNYEPNLRKHWNSNYIDMLV